MGFSTSGSLLIVFFGLFIALGSVYTATSNTSELLVDAYGDKLGQQDEIEETRINITSAVWHTTDENLTIRVDNVGSRSLSVDGTDSFVDGEYWGANAFGIRTVDGQETDIWDRKAELRLENDTTQPDRVKVVTDVGIAATQTVRAAGIEFTGEAISLDNTSDGTNEAIQFEITSTYEGDTTLLDVTVDSTNTAAEYINYADPIEEVYLSVEPDLTSSETTASGNFSIGETIVTDSTVVLEPQQVAQYTIGEFRDTDDNVVPMLGAEVTVTVSYEDPNGVERSLTFTTVVDS